MVPVNANGDLYVLETGDPVSTPTPKVSMPKRAGMVFSMPTLANFFTVNEERSDAALAKTAAVISKLKAND